MGFGIGGGHCVSCHPRPLARPFQAERYPYRGKALFTKAEQIPQGFGGSR